ncbi:hypothetical protein T10_1203 [Trichinella papuae]|uniref:Uncharacterized protein n=1 Tax=Trichinella papuae TaxID=268474 RepID=A0A0V1MRC4_9BILA|nr:hypothetical protein T10_1203 [Trichinella papuae]
MIHVQASLRYRFILVFRISVFNSFLICISQSMIIKDMEKYIFRNHTITHLVIMLHACMQLEVRGKS